MLPELTPDVGDYFVKQTRRYLVTKVWGTTVMLMNDQVSVAAEFSEPIAKLASAGYLLEKSTSDSIKY
jgi:hypothetical protein